jgi:phage terminase large subunit-like protein
MDRLNGRLCYAGLDLASSIDIAAFVLVFPDEMGFFDVVPYMWVPEDRIQERVHTDKVPYDAWVRDGHLIATEGNVIHYDRIEADIEELGKRYNIAEIGFDRWGAVQISQHLSDMGFTVVPFGQGFKDMSPPTKEFQKLIMSQKIRHNANPVMRWMFDNIAIRTDPAENVKMDKSRSTERIDGMVATVMGLGRAIVNAGESVYAERGVITL